MEFPGGFFITGITGENNFGLIFAPEGMKAAGIFTLNVCAAHPVEYSRGKINNPVHKAILVNKGSANAATGPEGRARMENLINKVKDRLGISSDEILVASTGVIGKQLEYSDSDIARLIEARENIEPDNFARAIMTTDTCPKIVQAVVDIGGKPVNITGIAKGAGMIAPNMATMLAFIMTDANVEKETLRVVLKKAADVSFNCLNVDGETSTNDSVFLAASGFAQNMVISGHGEDFEEFYEGLKRVCVELVEKLAADGEGATKFIKINIHGAVDDEAAKKAAKAISVSPLCKTAFYGASPNWGRIVSALGAAGIKFPIENLSLSINGLEWVVNGIPQTDQWGQVKKELEEAKYIVDVYLNSGSGQSVSYTCDFSPEYVRINAHYLS